MTWQPIETVPRDGRLLLLGHKKWNPVIAKWNVKLSGWCEYLGGDFYGTKPPFEPAYWLAIPDLPE